jgi:uncharacterized protein (TIGR03435 family)
MLNRSSVSGITGSELKKRIVRLREDKVATNLDLRGKVLLRVATLVAVAIPVVFGLGYINHVSAQTAPPSPNEIAAIWQGTVSDGGQDLRTEIKIANVAGGGYTTTLYSIDRGGAPDHATKTEFADGTLTFSIEALNVKYEGKMSANGKTITGNWTQGPNTQPLVLTRAIPEAAWPIPEPPKPMAADANPGFDVVTIKPGNPATSDKGIAFLGTHFIAFKTDMNELIELAYGMHTKQILGAPDWFGTDLFDIDGKSDVDGQASLHQMGEMAQKLLADRFALKFHHEQREIAAYIITVAGSGPKMNKTALGPNDHRQGFSPRRSGDLVVHNLDMAEFAIGMQSYVMDKPVVDHTGLTDKYDFTLKWTPDDSQFAQSRDVDAVTPPGAGDNPNAPPSLYTAVQEQLGLKIEEGKTMVDVIVIDHIEKPSPN